jgi:hypothetical protein
MWELSEDALRIALLYLMASEEDRRKVDEIIEAGEKVDEKIIYHDHNNRLD